MEYADEAESHFPHDYKMKRRMQLTEPLLSQPLDVVASACGDINNNADNVLAFVGSAFFKHHNSFEQALTANYQPWRNQWCRWILFGQPVRGRCTEKASCQTPGWVSSRLKKVLRLPYLTMHINFRL